MAGRQVNVFWVPEGGDRVRQFRLAVWPLYVFGGLGALILLMLIGAGAAYLSVSQTKVENRLLAAENDALRGELVALGAETSRLDQAVRSQVQLANEARLLAGLPPYSEAIALQGVGGSPQVGATHAQQDLTPGVRRTVGIYYERLDHLSRRLDFQEESFLEVKESVAANRERLEHLPTINPVVGPYFVSSGFGTRTDPFTGRPSRHSGIDLRAPLGTPFRATAAGRVTYVGFNGDFGLSVEIDHGFGLSTYYAHANDVNVRRGQAVSRGDIIGHVGHSGRTTGNHLHYEVRKGGAPVNPRQYILQGDHFLD
ncbi:MAG: M23 family metallopeptidase [Candidatus Eisenbacteria bacterium]|uniref:M23 family metallopeptidase n=1 Tax=Eiseniibacteriota bacterium TaxID=2212470 RepID=A0A938BPG9_UNCEI|nr:M23 family metallopeptidase [Candidatus Eisenbacteria bacterium]